MFGRVLESWRLLQVEEAGVGAGLDAYTGSNTRTYWRCRTVLQKNGGRLRETGSTTHMFINCGIIHIEKKKISEEEAFEIAINSGARDCLKINGFHEIVTAKEDFYKSKSKKQINIVQKNIDEFKKN